MQIDNNILIWFIGILLTVLAFIGSIGVHALLKMARDINEIKVTVMQVHTVQESHERRIDNLERMILVV